MLTGTLIKLVHLSQQPCVLNTRLVPDHNDKGYGAIEDAKGGQVYFSHDAVTNQFGFDLLREGQRLDYTLESGLFCGRCRCLSPQQGNENKRPFGVLAPQTAQRE